MPFAGRAAFVALAVLVLASAACDKLGGGSNYKGEVAAVADRIKSDLSGAQTVSPATKKRLEELLAKYQAERGASSSYKNLKDVNGLLDMIAANPERGMQFKQSLEQELQKALSDLQSEGP